MTVKVQVGPAQIAIHQGQTVLISEEDGQINWFVREPAIGEQPNFIYGNHATRTGFTRGLRFCVRSSRLGGRIDRPSQARHA